jgi:hypothetical protein
MGNTFNATPGTTATTLLAGAGAQIAAANPVCAAFVISNNGTNPMVVKFGSMPTSATDGMPLDPASAQGGQGGSLVLTGENAPSDSVFGLSALGTSCSVQSGRNQENYYTGSGIRGSEG